MPENVWVVPEKSLLRVALFTTAWVFGLFVLGHFIGVVATPLVFVLLATVLTMGLNPLVVRLETHLRLPRKIGAPLVVLGILAFLIGFIAVVIPLFMAQAARFSQTLPDLWNKLQNQLGQWVSHNVLLQPLLQGKSNLDISRLLDPSWMMNGLLGLAGGVLGLLASAVLLFVLVMFLLLQPEPLVKGVLSGIHPQHRSTVERTLIRIGSQLGSWLLGSLMVSAVVGLLVGIGLALLGFENAFLFGMIAGVTNLVPFVGPWMGISLPILVALSSGAWGLALGAAVVMLVVQQLDNYFLSPTVYGRTVQLHPASLLIGVLVFGAWLGFVGVFLAVPLVIICKALYEEVYLASLSRPEPTDVSIAQVVAAGQGEEATLESEERLEASETARAQELARG